MRPPASAGITMYSQVLKCSSIREVQGSPLDPSPRGPGKGPGRGCSSPMIPIMPNYSIPFYYPSKVRATAAALHNGDEIRPPLAQSLDSACTSAAVVPVVPAADLEALWKLHRSYTQFPCYLCTSKGESRKLTSFIHFLSLRMYKVFQALIASIGTFRSINRSTLDEQPLP